MTSFRDYLSELISANPEMFEGFDKECADMLWESKCQLSASRIRGYRARDGVTRGQLAVKLEISQYLLANLEKGRSRVPYKVAVKLAEIFNTHPLMFDPIP
jgi:DNA-binding XRE family transcriptional regulator